MAEYRIFLDPRNPGQFFACCGLLEWANLIGTSAEAMFQDDGTIFILYTDALLPSGDLKLWGPQDFDSKLYDKTLESLDLSLAGHALHLNWWLNTTQSAKSSLKTWGGQQTPRRLLGELLELLDASKPFDALFDALVFTTSRFGVDARSAWDALDAGYSPTDLKQAALTFPWVEVLAVIGLQGFRAAAQSRVKYRYSVWGAPLPASVARAACASPWAGLPATTFEFSIAVRGQGYKTFLFAEKVNYV
jgi:CRISPR-associated protein Csx14